MVDNTIRPQSGAAAPDVHRSRAQRMSQPTTLAVLREIAVEYGVCLRPVTMRRVLADGTVQVIDIDCGATRTSKCASCAAKAKKLRKVQAREGWHRTTEPIQPEPAADDQRELVRQRAEAEWQKARAEQLGDWDQAAQLAEQIGHFDQQILVSGLRGRANKSGEVKRRARSTRRRQDTVSLPRRHVSPTTLGQVYIGRDGRPHHSSMFLTLTLGSYGRVRRSDSTPVNLDTYDYHRAALDAVHFPALLDRFWQNLRRAVGWNVQYFGCVEPQRRLAPHAHYAARGSFPRAVFRQVTAGTYHQVWQPCTDTVMFPEDGPQPEWLPVEEDGDPADGGYLSPWTGTLLPTWEQAMDALDVEIAADTVGPAHVMRFGVQVHAANTSDPDPDDFDGDDDDQGVTADARDGLTREPRTSVRGMEAGTIKAEKAIGYLCKYITKSVDECHIRSTPREVEHHRRFQQVLRFTPCSDRCPNWLRYGIQPLDATPGMLAGRCKGRVHQPSTLGIKGRRILVSREWSGKTLADHKHDQALWVRQILAHGLGHELTDVQNPQPDAELVGQGEESDPNIGNSSTADPEPTREDEHDQAVTVGSDAAKVRWTRVNPGDPGFEALDVRLWRNLGQRIRQRIQWRTALDQATELVGAEAGTSAIDATAGGP
jgi:hypothetical protein